VRAFSYHSSLLMLRLYILSSPAVPFVNNLVWAKAEITPADGHSIYILVVHLVDTAQYIYARRKKNKVMTTYVQLVYLKYIYLLGYFDEQRIFLH
jgi:hypothetical protein